MEKQKIPTTRAGKRRAKRELLRELAPPRYMGPTIIYTESHKEVDGKMQKDYITRQNFKVKK